MDQTIGWHGKSSIPPSPRWYCDFLKARELLGISHGDKNPPRSSGISHRGFSLIKSIEWHKCTMAFNVSTHDSSVVYILGVVMMVDPGTSPWFTRNSSVKLGRFFFSPLTLRRMMIGPVLPEVDPVWTTMVLMQLFESSSNKCQK